MKRKLTKACVHCLPRFALVLCFVAGASGQAKLSPPDVPLLTPAWSNSYPLLTSPPEQWRRAVPAFPDDGNCIAIAGNGEAKVIGRTGRTLWTWKFGAVSRFAVAGSVAVSPDCNAIAMGGDSSYKYVWIADRRGHAISLPMASTPLAVAFDRQGESVAIGTGGSRMFLFSRGGKELWSTPPYSLYLPYGISFTSDNRFLLVFSGGAALLRVDGSVVWSLGAWGMNAASDLRTAVMWVGPNHGPGTPVVIALDESGKQLWTMSSDDPGAVVTPAGDKIIARVNIDQEPPKEEFNEPQETILRVFTHDGSLLKELPGIDGRPVAISPDGTRVLLDTGRSLDAIDLDGKRFYSIAASSTAYKIAPDFSAIVVFSWGSDGDLEYFKLK